MELEYSSEKVRLQCTSVKAEPWRIILQPLDEEKDPYVPCKIDEIAGKVKIVEIAEVSRHYG